MDRRHALPALLLGVVLLSRPQAAAARPGGCGSLDTAARTAPRRVADTIRTLESYVRAHPTPFPAAVHNELRHWYGAVDEARSMCHADAILAHSLMDDYTLSILSDWQLERDPGVAVVNLLTRAERYPQFVHLRAACLLKAADVSRASGKGAEAEKLYRRVLALARAKERAAPALRRYRALAEFRLPG